MVSGFIKQQQVGTANQCLRQVKAHTPAAGEVANGAFKLFVAETQTVQQAGGAGANCPCVDGVQLTVDGGDSMTVITLVGGVQFSFQLTVFTIAVDNIVESGFAQGRRLLIYPGKLPVARIGKVTAVSANLVFQQRKQGRFSAAVFADQTHFLTGIDGGGGVIQQDAHAAANL